MGDKNDKLKTAAMLGAAFAAGRYSGSASAKDYAAKIKAAYDEAMRRQVERVQADEAHRRKYWWTPRSLFFRFWKFISPF